MFYKDVLNLEGKVKVENEIAKAEKITAGEIKVLIVQNSSKFPGKTNEKRTEARANHEFFNLGLNHTKDHTGILIMLSIDERRVEIRAGQSINKFHDQETWQELADVIVAGMKENKPEVGICETVNMAGIILAEHFPIQPDDVNEISDEVVFKE